MPPSKLSRVRFEARKKAFDTAELARKLDAEWVDLTLPAQGIPNGQRSPDQPDSAGNRRCVHLDGLRNRRWP